MSKKQAFVPSSGRGEAGNNKRKLLIISGPTATGKTSLAIKLAKEFDGELISADSRQVYKGMDIGTGKEFSAEIPVWGYDLVNPNEDWSVAHFVKFANRIINEILERKKLPIIVGGTGLYISNLLNPPETLNIPPNKKLRVELEKLSVAELQIRLKKINSGRLAKMNESDRSNPRRLIRTIETSSVIPAKAGIYINKFRVRPGMTMKISLTASVSEIDNRIGKRVKERLGQGLEKEIKNLVKEYGWNSALSFTIGYQEWKPYFEDKCSIDEVIARWITHEKQYARRQVVWLKTHPPDVWLDISKKTSGEDIVSSVKQWYYE